MPYFSNDSKELVDATFEVSDDLIAAMNSKFDKEADDIKEVDIEAGITEETRKQELKDLADSIVLEIDSAEPSEIAFLLYMHETGETDIWVDDFTTNYDFYGAPIYCMGNREYAVINNIDSAFHDYAESYIDDCVLSEIPERYRRYFDTEQFINDMETDGYGQMALYDNEDNEIEYDGTTYHILRMN
jgi:hypothetical protein